MFSDKKNMESCDRWYDSHIAVISASWSQSGITSRRERLRQLKSTEELWQFLHKAWGKNPRNKNNLTISDSKLQKLPAVLNK